MFFILLLGLSALAVAGAAGYFSVLGIATLFSGSYYQVLIMAGTLEFGKLVATSYLYRYWTKTVWWLKIYLITAVLILMGITSLGIFGYLSAAYQVNSSKFSQIDQQIEMVNSQKELLTNEVEQNTKRIEMLNEVRKAQEERVQQAGNYKLPREQAYAAIDKANQEIQKLTERNQSLQIDKFNKDAELIKFNQEIAQAKDIGTFKFVAQTINKPLDTVVIIFICVLICVFDPLAVSLVLAYNVATRGNTLKEPAGVLPEPTPAPTDCPLPTMQPTLTPSPSLTPALTPIPTSTEIPFLTSTLTLTPLPTLTPTPTPTPTPNPTSTEIPLPTSTPNPTSTEIPLPTSTPTSTPEPMVELSTEGIEYIDENNPYSLELADKSKTTIVSGKIKATGRLKPKI
jgi:hypothetical protein